MKREAKVKRRHDAGSYGRGLRNWITQKQAAKMAQKAKVKS